jgi:hypothetical protein
MSKKKDYVILTSEKAKNQADKEKNKEMLLEYNKKKKRSKKSYNEMKSNSGHTLKSFLLLLFTRTTQITLYFFDRL